jgi:PST family polysaccharide transporter
MQFVLTLGSTMMLARLLAPTDFGLLAMIMAVIGFLRIFTDAGLSTATVQRDEITHAQVSNLFWINVALSGLMTLVMAASAPAIAWFYREPRLIAITLALSISFLLSGSAVQHMALLNRQMRFRAIAFIQVSSQLAGVVVGVGMDWLRYGYWSLVGLQLSVPLAALLLTWSVSRWRPQFLARAAGMRSMLSFGANLTASSFIYSLAGGADSLLIGRFYGSAPVGLYSRAGALLRRPVEQFLSPITAVFIPVLSRLQAQPERYCSAFLRVYEAIALSSFLFSGLCLGVARPVTLVVLGPKWEGAAVIFAAFTIAALSLPFASTCSWLFESQGRGRDALRASAILSSLAVCSFLAGLPFGPTGVAVAYSGAGVLVLLPILYYQAGRSGPVRTADLWRGLFRHLPVWGIVCGATFLIKTVVAERSPLIQLLVCAPAGLSVGVVFISIYAPSRRTALGLWDALREWWQKRKASAI